MQLPDADTVSFPATQTYSDGSVVKWDQPPLPGGGEPEHPAPMLTLAAGRRRRMNTIRRPLRPPTTRPAAQANSADNTARLLGGAALVVAALGIASRADPPTGMRRLAAIAVGRALLLAAMVSDRDPDRASGVRARRRACPPSPRTTRF